MKMRLKSMLAAAAIAALTAGAAAAQSSDMSSGSGMNNMSNGSGTNGAMSNGTNQGGAAVGDTSNATSADQAGMPASATVGDPTLITNGPVPDTPENRAKYGKPMSNAGRHTAPAGN
jgi:opacity protein-like surface antigen